MKFTVTWLEEAEDELARLWTFHLDRGAISAAADRIDSILKQDRESAGQSRADGFRVISVSPLTVYYRVQMDDRIVEVGVVHYYTRRGSQLE